MDIFEEIKEAVLSATPGEDTRNYYRNQGMKIEQERIIKLLEEQARECEKAGLWANGPDLRSQLQELHLGLNAAIALIKGEK